MLETLQVDVKANYTSELIQKHHGAAVEQSLEDLGKAVSGDDIVAVWKGMRSLKKRLPQPAIRLVDYDVE